LISHCLLMMYCIHTAEDGVVSVLNDTINQLRKHIDWKEQENNELTKTVAHLKTKLRQLSTTVDKLVRKTSASIERKLTLEDDVAAKETIINKITEDLKIAIAALEDKTNENIYLADRFRVEVENSTVVVHALYDKTAQNIYLADQFRVEKENSAVVAQKLAELEKRTKNLVTKLSEGEKGDYVNDLDDLLENVRTIQSLQHIHQLMTAGGD
jgi:chromosome segregation ATPase